MLQNRPCLEPRPGICGFDVLVDGRSLGNVETYHNPFHSRNCYLRLQLEDYDTCIAKPLVEALKEKIGSPLQVMLPSSEKEVTDFLVAGGFQRKRRCFEMEVTREDLKPGSNFGVMLQQFQAGTPEYNACCGLLFAQYSKNHEIVNPLTASLSDFCAELPQTVFCKNGESRVIHFAFVEDNEIAYVGSTEVQTFSDFARALLENMFAQYERFFFECDDCDEAAMTLKNLFTVGVLESFDTYLA